MTIARLGVAVFLILHGVSHPLVWGVYRAERWDPRHSWLTRGDATMPALVLAGITAACFVAAAFALVTRAQWTPYAALGGATASLLLIGLTFNLRWWAGVTLDAVVIVLAVRALTS
ncbi:MAG: hypothetical protein K1X87_08820 [Dehalococcoidia bacterium]|nr:hypothetical protein [Dehalococcoidia bacterium]